MPLHYQWKVETINKHIDNILKEAPIKLQISVKVSDADRKTIQDILNKQYLWMTTQTQKHIREVHEMFYDERKRVQDRYKEYDEIYLGHDVQYDFWVLLRHWYRYFRLGYLPDARQSLPLDEVI